MNASRGEIIDIVGQRSPRSNPCENYDMSVFRGKVIDNAQSAPNPAQSAPTLLA